MADGERRAFARASALGLALVFALTLTAACSSGGSEGQTTNQANPCATRGATYLLHAVEQRGGTCGPVPDEIFNVNPDGTTAGSSTRSSRSSAAVTVMRFSVGGGIRLRLPRSDALDLLAWLGLDRPEFGAVPASDLAARCRRRLWPMPRNVDPASPPRPAGTLRSMTARLLELCEAAPSASGPVIFG